MKLNEIVTFEVMMADYGALEIENVTFLLSIGLAKILHSDPNDNFEC